MPKNKCSEAVPVPRIRGYGLDDTDRRFYLVMTESALRGRIASGRVMAEQCQHILKAAGRPNVEVYVLPWTAQLPAFPTTNFVLLDNTVVMVSMVNGYSTLRGEADLAAHRENHDSLRSAAVSGERMVSLVRTICDDHLNVSDEVQDQSK